MASGYVSVIAAQAASSSYATGDQQGRYPAAMIDALVQEDLGGDCVGHKSKGCGSRRNQADVPPGQAQRAGYKTPAPS